MCPKYVHIYIYTSFNFVCISLRVQRHGRDYENMKKPWLFYKTNIKFQIFVL